MGHNTRLYASTYVRPGSSFLTSLIYDLLTENDSSATPAFLGGLMTEIPNGEQQSDAHDTAVTFVGGSLVSVAPPEFWDYSASTPSFLGGELKPIAVGTATSEYQIATASFNGGELKAVPTSSPSDNLSATPVFVGGELTST